LAEKKRKWRWGVNRWIVLAAIIGAIVAMRYFPPVMPHIQLPPEAISPAINLPGIGPFYLSNSMLGILIVDVIVILIAWSVKRFADSGKLVPGGVSGIVEVVIEALYNMTESTAGKWTATIFPYFVTITFVVLFANWLELIPGVDTIGYLHAAEQGVTGMVTQQATPWLGLITAQQAGAGAGKLLTSFVRTPSTDLNFTIALALISVGMTQVIGVRAHGIDFFSKYFNVKTMFSKPFFGFLDWFVSILEAISEFSKLLSFSFRLFGNIFAGTVLVFVMTTLIPAFVPTIFLLLELFIGLIQALVFGMLTMIFMAQAAQGGEAPQGAEAAPAGA
jgi:F-type H+-transporting ATPase subunit a